MQPYVGAPPAPQRPRSYMVPIVVLATVLFLLVAAIVVVASTRAGKLAGAACPVGEWNVVDYREVVAIEALDTTVTFTGGKGTILRLKVDGTGETDYGRGSTFSGQAPDGRGIRLDITGPVRFTYRLSAKGDSVFVTPAGNDATFQLSIDGEPYGGRQKFVDDLTSKSYSVECDEDSLTQDGSGLTVGYERR